MQVLACVDAPLNKPTVDRAVQHCTAAQCSVCVGTRLFVWARSQLSNSVLSSVGAGRALERE